MSQDSDKSQAGSPTALSPDSRERQMSERRIAPRYPFTTAAEVVDLQTNARVAGRSSDLGLGGCYIDTLAPFAVGTSVRIRLEKDLREFEATGVVTYALVSMGMGLSFTKIKPEHQTVLKTWVAELSGEKEAIPEFATIGSEEGLTAAIANNRKVLTELINLMIRKQVISENEGAALLRMIFRELGATGSSSPSKT
jgi:hypothetical protein